MERRPEEIAQLQARAREALEHPDKLEPRAAVQNMRQTLRLWHDPAFGVPTVWAVFEQVGVPSHSQEQRSPAWMVVREVTWDRKHDLGRFADPLQGVREGFSAPPTVRVCDGRIVQEVIISWLQEVRELPIAVLGIKGPIGLDGESWGIEVDEGFLQVRLQWREAGPTEWAQFTQVIARLHRLLSGAVAESGPQNGGGGCGS